MVKKKEGEYSVKVVLVNTLLPWKLKKGPTMELVCFVVVVVFVAVVAVVVVAVFDDVVVFVVIFAVFVVDVVVPGVDPVVLVVVAVVVVVVFVAAVAVDLKFKFFDRLVQCFSVAWSFFLSITFFFFFSLPVCPLVCLSVSFDWSVKISFHLYLSHSLSFFSV